MKKQNYNEIALRLSNYLKRKLKEKGMTVADVARQLGYSERHVRRWLNGQATRFDTVEQIAFLFDVSVWEVLADEDEDLPSSFKNKYIFTLTQQRYHKKQKP